MQRVVSKKMPKGFVFVLLCAVFSSGNIWRHKKHAKRHAMRRMSSMNTP